MDDRLKLLEERNERLFILLGALDYMAKHETDSTMSVQLVRELLEQVAYGDTKEGGKDA